MIKFESAVYVEKGEKYTLLNNREEGTWIRLSNKVYENICWHINNMIDFDFQYNELLSKLVEYHIIKNNDKKRILENITVMLTNKCNLSCKHCCAAEISAKKDISVEVLDKIILLKPKQITVTGGEPLLHENIEKILCYIKNNYEGKLVLSTNGTLVNCYAELIDKYIDEIEISIDGIDEKGTRKYRGAGVYNQVIENVKMLRNKGFKVSLSLVTYDGHEIEDFYKFNKLYGTFPILRELDINKKVLENFEQIVSGGKEKYLKITKEALSKSADSYELRTCGAISYQLFVDSEGNVYPCGGLAENCFNLGNIKEKNVYERIINQSESYYKDVLELMLSQEKFAACKDCKIRHLCWNCLSEVVSKSMIDEVFREYCKSNKDKWIHIVWDKEKDY